MLMPIKYIAKEEHGRMQEIATYCFTWMHNVRDVMKKYFQDYVEEDYALGYYDDNGTLMSQVVCFPFEIYIDGVAMKMGGIGLVSSMPEERHGGKIGLLLKEWLAAMKDRGQVVSMLGPFSFEFYRKYGYEIGIEMLHYTIPVEYLKTFKGKYTMKAYEEKDLPCMNELYKKFAKAHNGCAVRDSLLWNELTLSHPWDDQYGRYTYVCYDNDNFKGYMIFSIKEGEMHVHEIVYDGKDAMDTLLSFIYSHQAQINEVNILVPMDDGIQYIMPNPRIKREIQCGMMFRVVDVKVALAMKNYSGANSGFSIKITDPAAAWNETPLKITILNGKIDIDECNTADLSCDIQTFSQIFIGYLTPSMAFSLDKLRGEYKSVIEMEKAFKKSSTFNTVGF